MLPKVSFKALAIAALVMVVFLTLVVPLVYDHFGDGGKLSREAVLSSAELRSDCGGRIGDFIIIPWKLSLDGSLASGRLEIGYWFKCGNDFATENAVFYRHGAGWIADEIEVKTPKKSYRLVPAKDAPGNPDKIEKNGAAR
jgi:hypothetical protein